MKRIVTLIAAAILAAPHAVPAGPEHDHGHSAESHDQSEAQRLPVIDIGGWAVTPLLHGAPAPGGEADITLLLEGPGFPKAVRAWVGNETADQTGKTRLDKSGDQAVHGHLPMPKVLATADALWIEIETAKGKQRRSVALPGAGMESHGQAHSHSAATLSATVSAAADGVYALVLKGADGKSLAATDLVTSHGTPIHLVLLDGSLTDFHHVRPTESAPGQWSFTFTPKNPGPYRVYAEAKPLTAETSSVAQTTLVREGTPRPLGARVPTNPTVDGVSYALAWETEPMAEHKSRFAIRMAASDGTTPKLEPIFGKPAHVFVVSPLAETFAHAHSDARTDGAVGELAGELPPLPAGKHRMFLHAKVKGREVIIPFDMQVATHDHAH